MPYFSSLDHTDDIVVMTPHVLKFILERTIKECDQCSPGIQLAIIVRPAYYFIVKIIHVAVYIIKITNTALKMIGDA